jgi:hypothetical protein
MVLGIVAFGAARPTNASEVWTCIAGVGEKEFPNTSITYPVNGEMLTPNRGSSRPKILLNDDHLLIAFKILSVRPETSRVI